MAECCTMARCSQERRLFRRELQKWSKEMLCIMGLERLAEELMGVWRWKILSQPFTELEDENPSDWSPEETCFVCNAKKLPPYDPASGILSVVDGYKTLRIDTDEHSASSDQGATPGSYSSCSSALSPWYTAALPAPKISRPISPLEQPLDLSVSATRKKPDDVTHAISRTTKSNSAIFCDGESSNNSVLKVPQIPQKPGQKKRVDGNSKRSYTEEELQAALRDIQSGKLGTRRAAVMYGIPRSTLRNKVYKLANESKSRAHCRNAHSSSKGKDQICDSDMCEKSEIVADSQASKNESVSSAGESLRQLLKHTITQKNLSSSKNMNEKQVAVAIETKKDQQKSEAPESFQMLGTLECSNALGPVLAQVFTNIHHLALGKYKENLYSSNQSLSALKDDLKLPILPDIIRRLTEERMEVERDCCRNSEGTEDYTFPLNVNSSESLNNVILKVPSFKATKHPPPSGKATGKNIPPLVLKEAPELSSQELSGSKGVAVSLKEIIPKNLSQREKIESHDFSVEESCEKLAHSSNQEKHVDSESWISSSTFKECGEVSASNLVECSKSEKRTRPKRGRYRNYDRDNLARAVHAVRKGEMSVHRAGTLFGVPHSTLEYKVKERHLLRPKKKDLFSNSNSGDISDLVSESKTQYELPVNSKDSKNNYKYSGTHNGLKSHPMENHRPSLCSFPSNFSLWQSIPLYSPDSTEFSSNNFFASHMMRKLQENAVLQEEQKKNKSELGILESLIRSTLDKPISPGNGTALSAFGANSVTDLSDTCGKASV